MTTVRRRLAPEDRREQLLDAAARAFDRADYEDVAVADVAAAAGVSEGLVFRYFPTKAALYAEVVRAAVTDLGRQQQEVVAGFPPGTPALEVLTATTRLYVEFARRHAHHRTARATAHEPAEAREVRAAARSAYVDALAALLDSEGRPHSAWALWGFMGFIDAACDAWIARGAPEDESDAVVAACLGALTGALAADES